MRKLLSFYSVIAAGAMALTACGNTAGSEADNIPVSTDGSAQSVIGTVEENDTGEQGVVMLSAATKSSDLVDFGSNKTKVDLDSGTVDGGGAVFQNGVLTVARGGVYTLSGTLADGMIYVDTDENVMLELSGVSVTNSSGAALYCYNAKNLYLKLTENTVNSFADRESYSFDGAKESKEDDEPNAAIYSKDNLIICGEGELKVVGSYNTGISCKDDMTVENGIITVEAKNNGIRGKDSLVVENGEITVVSGADGIKSANETGENKGFLAINGGKLTITAGEDGIQAAQQLSITGGEIAVTTVGEVASGGNDMGWGGRKGTVSTDTASTDNDATSKGIKSGGDMAISGGKITVTSTDHCIHSAGAIILSDGDIELSSSSGKGISAHGDLTVNGGRINVENSTEGLESKAVLTVNGGEITVKASDDGFNAGGGSDSFGMNRTDSDGTVHDLIINGGRIYIDASGDGIDSNGNITINGGTIIISGPTSGGDGALDSGDGNYSITVNGGTLLAAGSLQMAGTPSDGSSQNTIAVGFTEGLKAGSTFCITDSSGKELVIYTLQKNVQHIVFSSPEIATCGSYNIYTDGSANGVASNGLYSEGSGFIASGSPMFTVTVSSVVTEAGSSGGGMGNMGGMGGHGGFGGNGGQGGNRPDGNKPDGSMPENMTPPDGSKPENMTSPEGMTPPDGSIPDGSMPDNMTPPDGDMPWSAEASI